MMAPAASRPRRGISRLRCRFSVWLAEPDLERRVFHKYNVFPARQKVVVHGCSRSICRERHGYRLGFGRQRNHRTGDPEPETPAPARTLGSPAASVVPCSVPDEKPPLRAAMQLPLRDNAACCPSPAPRPRRRAASRRGGPLLRPRRCPASAESLLPAFQCG